VKIAGVRWDEQSGQQGLDQGLIRWDFECDHGGFTFALGDRPRGKDRYITLDVAAARLLPVHEVVPVPAPVILAVHGPESAPDPLPASQNEMNKVLLDHVPDTSLSVFRSIPGSTVQGPISIRMRSTESPRQDRGRQAARYWSMRAISHRPRRRD